MIIWWQWNIVCSFPPLTWQMSLILQTEAKCRETRPHIHIRQKVFGYLNYKVGGKKNLTGSNVWCNQVSALDQTLIQFLGVKMALEYRLSLEYDSMSNLTNYFSFQALGSFYFIHESLKNIHQFDFKGECPSIHHHYQHTSTNPSLPMSWNEIFFLYISHHTQPFVGYSCFHQN